MLTKFVIGESPRSASIQLNRLHKESRCLRARVSHRKGDTHENTGSLPEAETTLPCEEWGNIPEDDILHSHLRENLKSYIALTGWTL
jgi:hypothetical protein